MEILAVIAEWSILAFGLVLLAAQLAAQEVGYWFGRRSKEKAARGETESVGVVVGGMLGLLAFVLALTLSFANTRYSERRAGTLAEANAIGTAWLRAEALGTARAQEMARLLEDYVQVRAAYVEAGRDRAILDALTQRTNALQSRIWGHMAAIVREQPNPVSAALMAAVNEVFDLATAERFAFETPLPPQLFWLLLGMTLLTMAALGYQLGLRERPVRLLVVALIVMWTAVIVDILDLGSARVGALRVGTAAYEWTLQGFKGGVSVPPEPAGR